MATPLVTAPSTIAEAPATSTPLLDKIAEENARAASRYRPVLTPDEAAERYRQIEWYYQNVMQEGVDYGKIPGVDKPFLFKPGAQGLCTFFGYVPGYEELEKIEDWSGASHGGEPLFFYSYRCVIWKDDARVGEGMGSANSWESKFRYRWISEDVAKTRPDFASLPKRGGVKTMFEPTFALDKAETTGKYGKPAEYWANFRKAAEEGRAKLGKKQMGTKEFAGYFLDIDETQYRIPNDGFPDVINTCQKQGTKRAMIEAVLSATGASRYFTQDEDAVSLMQPYNPQPPSPAAETKPAAEETKTAQAETDPKPATERGTEYPEEIRVFCLKIIDSPTNKTMDVVKDVLAMVKSAMAQKDPEFGEAKYQAVAETFNAQHKGVAKTKAMFVELVQSLWAAYQALIPGAADHGNVTDEDVPL